MTLAIETIELTHRYKKLVALDRLNLQVPQGCIYGFIGPNGAGKTTTLRLLAGLQTPTSGEIRLMGERLTSRLAQRFVGYMPDFFRRLRRSAGLGISRLFRPLLWVTRGPPAPGGR